MHLVKNFKDPFTLGPVDIPVVLGVCFFPALGTKNVVYLEMGVVAELESLYSSAHMRTLLTPQFTQVSPSTSTPIFKILTHIRHEIK
jgi:hypothetical protein